MTLQDVMASSHVVICCGSGGVGKTTSAAVLAMHAARHGRRAVVVTIDPARRLADALGLEGLSNEPALVDGPWSGQMWAMMLDTKMTFDGLVRRYSRDEAQAESILANTFYRNISSSLSGTQEYMASEKLYELAVEGDYDLIVVDTPPTRNALDFLEAPQRLARFLDHRLYRVLMMPTRGIVKAVNMAAQTVMRSVAKVVGAEVIADAIAFFSAFDGMEQGFKDRARKVDELLRQDDTAFVLIASPKADTVTEAGYFAAALKRLGIQVKALIVNRMSPVFGEAADMTDGTNGTGDADRSGSDGGAGGAGGAGGSVTDQLGGLDALARSAPAGSALADLVSCLAESRSNAAGERSHLRGIAADVAPAPVVGVAIQPFEVSDLESLTKLDAVMFDPGSALSDIT